MCNLYKTIAYRRDGSDNLAVLYEGNDFSKAAKLARHVVEHNPMDIAEVLELQSNELYVRVAYA